METVIRAEHGAVAVVIRLFGDVSERRLEVEQRIAKHRAEQLGHVPVKRKGWIPPVDWRGLASVGGRHGDNADGIDWID